MSKPSATTTTPPRLFWVADLEAQGDLRSCEPYEYGLLERIPGAIEVISTFSSHLYRSPDHFEVSLGSHDLGLKFRFTAPAPSVGLGVLRHMPSGDLISVSALASGLDPQSDAIIFDVLQKHLMRELRGTPHEPGLDLLQLKQRPIVTIFGFGSPRNEAAQHLAALADRCLSAAFFRYHHLV